MTETPEILTICSEYKLRVRESLPRIGEATHFKFALVAEDGSEFCVGDIKPLREEAERDVIEKVKKLPKPTSQSQLAAENAALKAALAEANATKTTKK